MKSVVLSLIFFNFTIVNARADQLPVSTAVSVDLQKYLGKWYEIVAIPQFFERKCVANTSAEYALAEDELIAVVNSCETKDGARSAATGRAKVVDKISNSKLKVTFVNLLGWQFRLGGDYWILAIGDDYAYAIVGSPGRDYAWVLSRKPAMTAAQLNAANQILLREGYDTCKLISKPQASGLREILPLCELVVKTRALKTEP